jgi:DNA-binding NarL/FixJ family response regulator
VKVLIADDHPVVRQGIKQILTEKSDIMVAGEAVDGPDALEKCRASDWDAVVLDLSMPGGELDLLKALKRERPTLPVLVLSVHPEDQFAVRALNAGASGYLTKDSAPALLVDALRKVAAGGRYMSPWLADRMASRHGERLPHERLSDREYQVMRLIASGKTPTQIAGALGLSVKTVSTYRSRVLQKMERTTSADLVAYAVRHHLAE